jgi:hypothetical protein
LPKTACDAPPDAEAADAHALRALHEGTASPEQQKRALAWVLQKACEVGGMPWWPDDRSTSFALGRLFVGKQIGRLLICDLSTLTRRSDHATRPSSERAERAAGPSTGPSTGGRP